TTTGMSAVGAVQNKATACYASMLFPFPRPRAYTHPSACVPNLGGLVMSKFLTEAGWKAVLNKPKNLGLRVQGTGVSDRRRKYETANNNYVKGKTKDGADGVLKLLQDLKSHAQTQSTSHKAFTEATDYLKEVVKAAGKREEELEKDKEALD